MSHSMSCMATQDGWVIVKSSDKMGSTGGGNGNPLQYSCQENTMDHMKKQNDMTPEDEPKNFIQVRSYRKTQMNCLANPVINK